MKKDALDHTADVAENESEINEVVSNDDEDDDGVIFKYKKQTNVPGEGYGASPLEDRYGRHLRVRTRMCFCPPNAASDCRFHNPKEVGWEECPHLEAAKKEKKSTGRWLWARNPLYGKPPTDEEILEWAARDAALASIEAAKAETAEAA